MKVDAAPEEGIVSMCCSAAPMPDSVYSYIGETEMWGRCSHCFDLRDFVVTKEVMPPEKTPIVL